MSPPDRQVLRLLLGLYRILFSMTAVARPALLGRGIYDPTEAARLIRVHPETLARWTTGRDPLVLPAFERFFDFEDLVSLASDRRAMA